MRFARFCLPVVLLCTLAACDSAEPREPLTALAIDSTNVEADGVLYGNALLVQLSAPLDTASLAAERIVTTEYLEFLDPDDPSQVDRRPVPLDVWLVERAQAVLLNDGSATFWYDPSTASLLVMDENREDGSSSSPFEPGENTVELTAAVRGADGEALAAPVAIPFRRGTLVPEAAFAALSPNPVLATTVYSRTYDERIARFVGLPETATIVIQDPLGETVTLEKDDQNSTLDWATPLDRTGLFSYEVLQEGEAFARGIAVLAAEAYRPDAP